MLFNKEIKVSRDPATLRLNILLKKNLQSFYKISSYIKDK